MRRRKRLCAAHRPSATGREVTGGSSATGREAGEGSAFCEPLREASLGVSAAHGPTRGPNEAPAVCVVVGVMGVGIGIALAPRGSLGAVGAVSAVGAVGAVGTMGRVLRVDGPVGMADATTKRRGLGAALNAKPATSLFALKGTTVH